MFFYFTSDVVNTEEVNYRFNRDGSVRNKFKTRGLFYVEEDDLKHILLGKVSENCMLEVYVKISDKNGKPVLEKESVSIRKSLIPAAHEMGLIKTINGDVITDEIRTAYLKNLERLESLNDKVNTLGLPTGTYFNDVLTHNYHYSSKPITLNSSYNAHAEEIKENYSGSVVTYQTASPDHKVDPRNVLYRFVKLSDSLYYYLYVYVSRSSVTCGLLEISGIDDVLYALNSEKLNLPEDLFKNFFTGVMKITKTTSLMFSSTKDFLKEEPVVKQIDLLSEGCRRIDIESKNENSGNRIITTVLTLNRAI